MWDIATLTVLASRSIDLSKRLGAAAVDQPHWVRHTLIHDLTNGERPHGKTSQIYLCVRHGLSARHSVFTVTVDTAALGRLFVRPVSTVKSGSDLEGKRLEVDTHNNIVRLYVRAWAEKTGGDLEKVTYREVLFPQLIAAVEQGNIDAAFVVEPFLSGGAKAGTVKIVGWFRPEYDLYEAVAAAASVEETAQERISKKLWHTHG